jgi:N-acetylmuramoyl-L-alanine amidase
VPSWKRWRKKKPRENTSYKILIALSLLPLAAWADSVAPSTFTPVAVSTPIPIAALLPVSVQGSTPAFVTVVHPAEGVKLPPLKEIFVFGAVVPGSTLTINGSTVPVHSKGGYLAMVPLAPGDILLGLDATAPGGQVAHLDRRFSVAAGFMLAPSTPTTIEKGSITPSENLLLSAGDTLQVTFQGSPQGQAEFAIEGVAAHLPMVELGNTPRGVYEGSYVIPPGKDVKQALITVILKKRETRKEAAAGRLTIESGGVPRMGLITDDTVAARTAVDGGYDVFLYKGMRVRLTGKIGSLWRVRFSALQSGWVKDSAIQELPGGTLAPQSLLTNVTIAYQGDSSVIRVPLGDVLPYKVEQTLEPPSLIVTLFGAADKTDLIRYDPVDPLVRLVRWRQLSSDVCQLIIEPKFKKWWGFDVRYEGSTMVIEVRKPWMGDALRGMTIAVDPGHGGSDTGAVGPHATREKDANLEIAQVVKSLLEKEGAKPFLTRTVDMDVSLYDRPRIAWKSKARLLVSVHCNASGLGENPLWNNGSSVYWYQPQSQALAEAVHASYRKRVSLLPDHGLYFADLAVCRMTQMPAILTEQAFIILPEQEAMIFDPAFQKTLAGAIVNGIKAYVAGR